MPDPHNPQTWVFVRTAGLPEDDSSVVQGNGTLWHVGDVDGEPHLRWVHPREVLQHGLVGQVREGAQHERQHGRIKTQLEMAAEGDTAEMQSLPSGESASDWIASEGHTGDWRWYYVGDRVALDNRPMLDRAHNGPGEIEPEFQHIVVPFEVLEALVRNRQPAAVAS